MDREEDRPGVPMERTPPAPVEGAHWDRPEPQDEGPPIKSVSRPVTPVYGTAQPPHGVSGVMRRMAYRLPEHHARRWMLLLMADRVEAYGTLAAEKLRRPRTLAALFTVAVMLARFAWRRR